MTDWTDLHEVCNAALAAKSAQVEKLIEQIHKIKFHADQFSDDDGSSWWCVGLIVKKALEIASAAPDIS